MQKADSLVSHLKKMREHEKKETAKTREQKTYDALLLLHTCMKIISDGHGGNYLHTETGKLVVQTLNECDPYNSVLDHIFY